MAPALSDVVGAYPTSRYRPVRISAFVDCEQNFRKQARELWLPVRSLTGPLHLRWAQDTGLPDRGLGAS